MMLVGIASGAVALGAGAAVLLLASPRGARLPRERRRPVTEEGEGALAGAAEAATGLVGRLIRPRSGSLATSLDLAGIRMRPQDFVFLVAVGSLALVAVTLLLGGGLFAAPAAMLSPVAAVLLVRVRVERRRRAFGEQLDGTLQLMASSLRAGYSMMQVLTSVAKQSEEPTASELARIVNETRVGRPVVAALEEAAERMSSEDFRWATQAIAINREVGGSLAEVLDRVAGTIRERGQIRRHVASLSAEGRMSAVILMVLPFAVCGFLVLINPTYLLPLVQTGIGIGLLVFSGVLFTVGGVWLSKVVQVKF
ncbi:type II secretion system F family protein [Agrococcus jenensis]|uniref:Tight adherence protein B n=1 Tax=Agrococcus jenensis TaxID=46353 RepID=A0A3N2AU37_9MICO|nr:type II secretion system F family protein [Agrococcus jenensis]ROR66428.1 tight adherence protein B [Agrococcus jenensis]